MTTGFDQYECDCTRTGYYGENCTTRKYLKSLLVEMQFCSGMLKFQVILSN